jgi:acetyltransferase-like isoleucine patch superfamily enzyme
MVEGENTNGVKMPIDIGVKIGSGTKIHHPELVNIYGKVLIGRDGVIGCFVEIGPGVVVGDRCRIQSKVYIPSGVFIGNDVFIGPDVTFLNDKKPPSGNWEKIYVEDDVSIGGGALILPGVRLEKGCRIGAGAVVTKTVEAGKTVVGVPAKCMTS